MMTFVKAAALFVASTCFVWIGVLWRWRATVGEPGAVEVALHLFVLPGVVFALILAGQWAIRGALARRGAEAAATARAAAAPVVLASPAGDAAAPAGWYLLNAWAHTAAGDSVDAAMAALAAGAPRPAPDAALRDDAGLPVLTARIVDLDTPTVEAALARHAATRPTAVPVEVWMPCPLRAVRALAALAPLVDELARSLSRLSQQWAQAPLAESSGKSASESPFSTVATDRIVRLCVAWPTDWTDETCTAAQVWLTGRLCDPLVAALPPRRWSIQAQRMNGGDLLSAAARTLDALQRQGRDDPVVLIACHSDLDTAGIQALEARQRLFQAEHRPKVAIAGEGAAIVVVSGSPDAVDETPRMRLTIPAIAQRSRSIEAPGRTAFDETLEMVRLGLSRAASPGMAVARLASDADQHTARAAELFAVTLALMPDLDPAADLCLAGALVGRLEAVAPLLALGCAAAQAREARAPALALSLGDLHWRMAAVLCPESTSTASA